jgi:hypothetical protein
MERLDEPTLAKLQDYVSACKNVNSKKKAPPISKVQMLGAAKGLAHEQNNKISALHGRGATFGAQPYMDPIMPRPMAGVAPGTASRGTGSRIGARARPPRSRRAAAAEPRAGHAPTPPRCSRPFR